MEWARAVDNHFEVHGLLGVNIFTAAIGLILILAALTFGGVPMTNRDSGGSGLVVLLLGVFIMIAFVL